MWERKPCESCIALREQIQDLKATYRSEIERLEVIYIGQIEDLRSERDRLVEQHQIRLNQEVIYHEQLKKDRDADREERREFTDVVLKFTKIKQDPSHKATDPKVLLRAKEASPHWKDAKSRLELEASKKAEDARSKWTAKMEQAEKEGVLQPLDEKAK